MFKKALSLILAIITLISVMNITTFTASAEENNAVSATADEASTDEAKLVISDVPKSDPANIDGLVIGYIGDVNQDDKINVKDATYLQKSLAKIVNLTEGAKLLADADNNGKLNVRDATTIQKYIAGFEVNSKIWHLVYETGIHSHNFVELVVAPTCEKKGYIRSSCICGEESFKYKGEPIGHNYGSAKVIKPTCVDYGYTLIECTKCDHSYKKNSIRPTEIHTYNSDNYCSVCNAKKKSYDVLKDFLIYNGTYDNESCRWNIYLDTGYDVDYGAVAYDEKNDCIYFCYGIYGENGLNTGEVSIQKDDPYFRSYVRFPKRYQFFTAYNCKDDQNFNVTYLVNLSCLFYTGYKQIPEKECMQISIDFINTALAIYYVYQEEFPVTLYDLGFTSFKL